jgi:hypothetical protein
MKNSKPIARLKAAFEKTDAAGSRVIHLTQFEDGNVYLEGAEEVIFEGGENSLKSAFDYLERKGYRKKT